MQRQIVGVCVVILSVCVPHFAAAGQKSSGVPRFDAAVDKGLAYLHAAVEQREPEGGQLILAAYAMVKCGVPNGDPIVKRAIAAAAVRSNGGIYQPISDYDHIYGAGVDSLLLSDVDPDLYQPNLQGIANYVQSAQRADGSWSGPTATSPGDVSMSQYGVLSLWACQRAGCNVAPAALDRAADFLMKKGNADGGWGYRPGTTEGPGKGASTHNMTMAGAGAVGICRLLLHGLRSPPKQEKKEEELVFGALQRLDPLGESEKFGPAYPDYKPQHAAGSLDSRVDRAFAWNMANFTAVSRAEHNIYYYYCLERAAAVGDLGKIRGEDWFIVYGDGLLQLQSEDGSFNTHTGPVVGTAFALLYYMRSTRQWINPNLGYGQLFTGSGNPFGNDAESRAPTDLSVLLQNILMCTFPDLDDVPVEFTNEVVRSVTSIDNPEKLVGEVETLKSLLHHPNVEVRRASCWALGRTADFKLIPLMLTALRDPSVDVNVEAIAALRYIARKPQGFGETLAPFHGLESASAAERLRIANVWRQSAITSWSNWYFSIRPHEEQGSFDQLLVAVPVHSEVLEEHRPVIID